MSASTVPLELSRTELETVERMLFNAQLDAHPIRKVAAPKDGWHINKDIALKLGITSNNVPKITQKLLTQKIIEKDTQGYWDARGRPSDLDVFCLREDKQTFRRLWRHFAAHGKNASFMTSDYYGRVQYRFQLQQEFFAALGFERTHRAELISQYHGREEEELFIAALPDLFVAFLDHGPARVQGPMRRLRGLFQSLSANRMSSTCSGRKYAIPPAEYRKIAEHKLRATIFLVGAFNRLPIQGSDGPRDASLDPESLVRRAYNHYLQDVIEEERRASTRQHLEVRARMKADTEKQIIRMNRKFSNPDDQKEASSSEAEQKQGRIKPEKKSPPGRI